MLGEYGANPAVRVVPFDGFSGMAGTRKITARTTIDPTVNRSSTAMSQ
jgi:hypothetical protein